MTEKNNACPDSIAWMGLTEIAECRLSPKDDSDWSLYKKLWEITCDAEQAGKAQPLGGDGSNGTSEEPIIGGNYDNVLGRAWHRFTPEEQAKIIEATKH